MNSGEAVKSSDDMKAQRNVLQSVRDSSRMVVVYGVKMRGCAASHRASGRAGEADRLAIGGWR